MQTMMIDKMIILQHEYDLQVILTQTYFNYINTPKTWQDLEHNIEVLKLRQEVKITIAFNEEAQQREFWHMFTNWGILWMRAKNLEPHYEHYIIATDPYNHD